MCLRLDGGCFCYVLIRIVYYNILEIKLDISFLKNEIEKNWYKYKILLFEIFINFKSVKKEVRISKIGKLFL